MLDHEGIAHVNRGIADWIGVRGFIDRFPAISLFHRCPRNLLEPICFVIGNADHHLVALLQFAGQTHRALVQQRGVEDAGSQVRPCWIWVALVRAVEDERGIGCQSLLPSNPDRCNLGFKLMGDIEVSPVQTAY